MRPPFHTVLLLLCLPAMAAPVEVRFVGVDGKGVGGTVVVLRSTDENVALAPPITAIMDQVDREFVPHVLIVPVGSRVNFPNSDSVSHQVYSFSPAKKFQLPLYHGKPYPPVVFDQRGVVTLGCNIHDRMRGYIYVVEAQHFGRTDDMGVFRAEDVRPGNYKVQIWHPLTKDVNPVIDQVIRVPDNKPTRILLRAAAPLQLRPESTVPSNWDAY